ncbi:hypothetical protein [Bartonella sp. CB169]|uniref:hypothetical protein n=1 Tax=Bartonella sp. CB169 TaxID=3112257 RepID=UPI00300E1DD8
MKYWIVTRTAKVIAIVSYKHFWCPELNPWIFYSNQSYVVLILNLVVVKLFSELEFWFDFIKALVILVLIIVGFYIIFTDCISPNGTVISFSNM